MSIFFADNTVLFAISPTANQPGCLQVAVWWHPEQNICKVSQKKQYWLHQNFLYISDNFFRT